MRFVLVRNERVLFYQDIRVMVETDGSVVVACLAQTEKSEVLLYPDLHRVVNFIILRLQRFKPDFLRDGNEGSFKICLFPHVVVLAREDALRYF